MCPPESRTIPSTASKSFCPGTSHSRRPTPRTTRTNTTDIVSTTPDRGHDQPRPPDSRQHGELRTLTSLRQSAAFLPLIEIVAFESPYRTFLLDNEE